MNAVSAVGFNVFFTFGVFTVGYFMAGMLIESFRGYSPPAWPLVAGLGIALLGFWVGIIGVIWRAFL